MPLFNKGLPPDRQKGAFDSGIPGDVFNFLSSTGYGAYITPAVVCLRNQFPQLFTGNWFCFHGDGTSHGPLSPLSPVNSPTTQTLSMAGNGLNCSPITRQRLDGSTQNFTTPVTGTPLNDWSICTVFLGDASLNTYGLLAYDNNGLLNTITISSTSTGAITVLINNSTVLTSSANLIRPGAESVVALSYHYVGSGNLNTLTLYVDGVQTNQITTAPKVTFNNSTSWKLGGSTGLLKGAIRSAFLTENTISPNDAANIHNYLFPLPTGTRGEQLTFTRNSIASATCPDGTITWLHLNRPAIISGIKIRPTYTNLLQWSEQFSRTLWKKNNNASITENTWMPPDGSITGDTITSNDSLTDNGVYQDISIANAFDPSYTASVYLQSGSVTSARVSITFTGTSSGDVTTNVTGLSSTTIRNTLTATPVMYPQWVANTAYALNTQIVPIFKNGHWYKATTAGTSGSTQPTWPTASGSTVTDGSVVWTEQGTTRVRFSILVGTTPTTGNINAWGAQLETGSQTSDYIRSEATQTSQAQEVASFPVPSISTKEGSAQIAITPNWTGNFPSLNNAYCLSLSSGGAARLGFLLPNSNKYWAYNGSSQPSVIPVFTKDKKILLKTIWSASQNKFNVSNLTDKITGLNNAFAGFTSFNLLEIGSINSSGQPGIVLSDIVISTDTK